MPPHFNSSTPLKVGLGVGFDEEGCEQNKDKSAQMPKCPMFMLVLKSSSAHLHRHETRHGFGQKQYGSLVITWNQAEEGRGGGGGRRKTKKGEYTKAEPHGPSHRQGPWSLKG